MGRNLLRLRPKILLEPLPLQHYPEADPGLRGGGKDRPESQLKAYQVLVSLPPALSALSPMPAVSGFCLSPASFSYLSISCAGLSPVSTSPICLSLGFWSLIPGFNPPPFISLVSLSHLCLSGFLCLSSLSLVLDQMGGPSIQLGPSLQTAPQFPLLIACKGCNNVTFIDGISSFPKESLGWHEVEVSGGWGPSLPE